MALTPSTIRADLKCGKGAISKGEKCHKGAASQVQAGLTRQGNVKSGWQVRRQTWGERFSDDLKANFGYAIKNTAQVGAVVGGITGLAGGPVGVAGGALAGGAVGGTLGAVSAPLGAALSATVGHPTSVIERKSSRRTRKQDMVYASGFTVDYEQLGL